MIVNSEIVGGYQPTDSPHSGTSVTGFVTTRNRDCSANNWLENIANLAINMESLESTLQGKLKAVTFTLSKTDSILEKRNKITIQRHKDSLNSMLNAIQTLKQQIEEAKFTNGESEEDVGDWGKLTQR